MSGLRNRVLLKAFQALCAPEARRFARALQKPGQTQRALLAELLRAHESTAFGRARGLNGRLSLDDFRAQVPVSGYSGFAEWMDLQQASPREPVLAPGGVEIFERTSGSSGRRKLIPYNRALKTSFERYFRVWSHDLLQNGPHLETLRIFISISPGSGLSDAEEPSGFEDDTEYLSPWLRALFRKFLTSPLELKNLDDAFEFRLLLSAYLLADEDLEMISVWHPSFLMVLWTFMQSHRHEIAKTLSLGRYVTSRRTWEFPSCSRVIEILKSESPLRPQMFWPRLKWISAWDQAASRGPAEQLQALFPQALFQGKGLLATEAPMTIPLLNQGMVPFLTEVFFEFEGPNGDLFLLTELQVGEVYRLIVSQKGGLLRYEMRDLVRVTDMDGNFVPRLEFLGRDGEVSDLVGEKLSASYLLEHLEPELRARFGVEDFCVLPLLSEHALPSYLVLVSGLTTESELRDFVDARLSESFHYGYARRLGQLDRTQVRSVPALNKCLLDYYQSEHGMKWGDIKLKPLITRPQEARSLLDYLGVDQ